MGNRYRLAARTSPSSSSRRGALGERHSPYIVRGIHIGLTLVVGGVVTRVIEPRRRAASSAWSPCRSRASSGGSRAAACRPGRLTLSSLCDFSVNAQTSRAAACRPGGIIRAAGLPVAAAAAGAGAASASSSGEAGEGPSGASSASPAAADVARKKARDFGDTLACRPARGLHRAGRSF